MLALEIDGWVAQGLSCHCKAECRGYRWSGRNHLAPSTPRFIHVPSSLSLSHILPRSLSSMPLLYLSPLLSPLSSLPSPLSSLLALPPLVFFSLYFSLTHSIAPSFLDLPPPPFRPLQCTFPAPLLLHHKLLRQALAQEPPPHWNRSRRVLTSWMHAVYSITSIYRAEPSPPPSPRLLGSLYRFAPRLFFPLVPSDDTLQHFGLQWKARRLPARGTLPLLTLALFHSVHDYPCSGQGLRDAWSSALISQSSEWTRQTKDKTVHGSTHTRVGGKGAAKQTKTHQQFPPKP